MEWRYVVLAVEAEWEANFGVRRGSICAWGVGSRAVAWRVPMAGEATYRRWVGLFDDLWVQASSLYCDRQSVVYIVAMVVEEG